jgi:hypothetical protein
MLFMGLLWGLNVPNTPFPRLALTAHIGAMTEGMSDHPSLGMNDVCRRSVGRRDVVEVSAC